MQSLSRLLFKGDMRLRYVAAAVQRSYPRRSSTLKAANLSFHFVGLEYARSSTGIR